MKRIIWSTDIHLDFVGQMAFDDYAKRLADAAPDIILLSGDIADSRTVIDNLTLLDDRLTCPICFVLGNHDFYYSSISVMRDEVRQLCAQREELVYLTNHACVEISERVGLVGHDSWADARVGDYDRSMVMLNDYQLIRELAGLKKQKRRSVLQALGDAAAADVRQLLPQALERYEQVFFLTHVPPLREACWHLGHISDDQWSPHFTCQAMGDTLLEIARQYPHRQLTVLCGHTHSPGECHPLPNLHIITGAAEYRFPAINQVFEIETP